MAIGLRHLLGATLGVSDAKTNPVLHLDRIEGCSYQSFDRGGMMQDRRAERTCIDCFQTVQVVWICQDCWDARVIRDKHRVMEQLMSDVRALYPEMEVDGRKRKEETEDVAEGMLL
jgi:hypothetical protein